MEKYFLLNSWPCFLSEKKVTGLCRLPLQHPVTPTSLLLSINHINYNMKNRNRPIWIRALVLKSHAASDYNFYKLHLRGYLEKPKLIKYQPVVFQRRYFGGGKRQWLNATSFPEQRLMGWAEQNTDSSEGDCLSCVTSVIISKVSPSGPASVA